MGLLFIAGLIAAVTGAALASEVSLGSIISGIGCGLVVGSIFSATFTTNSIYAAANHQDIAVTVSVWEQRPSTLQPCHVGLDYDTHKKSLVLSGSDTVATPELLATVCSSK